MTNQANEKDAPQRGQFWRHRDYGTVMVQRRVGPTGYRCRVPSLTQSGEVRDAILPEWELTAEVTEEDWNESELRTAQGVAP